MHRRTGVGKSRLRSAGRIDGSVLPARSRGSFSYNKWLSTSIPDEARIYVESYIAVPYMNWMTPRFGLAQHGEAARTVCNLGPPPTYTGGNVDDTVPRSKQETHVWDPSVNKDGLVPSTCHLIRGVQGESGIW